MKKRLLSIVLSILLCVGIMPNRVYADDYEVNSLNLLSEELNIFKCDDDQNFDYSSWIGKSLYNIFNINTMMLPNFPMLDYQKSTVTDITDESNPIEKDSYAYQLESNHKYQLKLFYSYNYSQYYFSSNGVTVSPSPLENSLDVGNYDVTHKSFYYDSNPYLFITFSYIVEIPTMPEPTESNVINGIDLREKIFIPNYSTLESYDDSITAYQAMANIYPNFFKGAYDFETDFTGFEVDNICFVNKNLEEIDIDTPLDNCKFDNAYCLYIHFKADEGYCFDNVNDLKNNVQPSPNSIEVINNNTECYIVYNITSSGETGGDEEQSVIECSTWTSLRKGINDLFEDDPVEVPNSATFKLTQDITAPDNEVTLSITDGMDVTIDLNGHVLNRNLINADGTTKERPSVASGAFVPHYYNYSGSGSVIEVWGGKLTIKDSSPNTEHAGFVDNYNLWHLGTGSGKAKTIKGGIITGGIGMKYDSDINAFGSHSGMFNYKEMGGGILIANSQNAIVKLEAGNICGNLANHFGGGVAIINSDNLSEINPVNKSKFIMDGGSICNNYVAYETDSDNYLDDRLGGGGIYAFQGDVEINGGHIDENCSKHFAGGILGYANADIKITGGTINNNIGRITGAIWNYLNDNENHNEFSFTNDSIPEDLLLTAGEGKEIVITGNKSKERGNVYSNRLSLSGKVIIKDNVCDYVVVTKDKGFTSTACPDPQTGKLSIKDEYDCPIIKAWANDLMFITIDDAYSIIHPDTYPQFYTMYNGKINPINIVGNLTGSDINISVIGVDFPLKNPDSPDAGVCLWEITSGYLKNNPNARVDDFIHYNGPNMYYLAYDENWIEGEILVKPSQVEEVASVDEFNSAINDAIELFEKEPTSTCTIELSNSIGSQEEPIEELYVPENVNLELNGNDIYVDNKLFIEGDLSDSKKTDEEGKVVKGKLYMNDPSNLVYDSVIEAKENDETRQELVWTEATGNLKGYYCMYEIGANTKWDRTNEGKEWKKLGDKEAKFKIQPTAYDDLLELLEDNNYCDVYDKEHKVKVGLRLSVVKDGTNNPVTYDFAFSDDLTSKWACGEKGSPKTKCMSFKIIGLGSCRSVSAQAAIYSKPDANTKNAKFHSKLNVAGE